MVVGPAAGGHDLRRSLPESKDQGKGAAIIAPQVEPGCSRITTRDRPGFRPEMGPRRAALMGLPNLA